MLCVAGLLLYLVIRELSDPPVAIPIKSDPPTTAAANTVPTMLPWDASPIGAFQPVAAKPADSRAQLP